MRSSHRRRWGRHASEIWRPVTGYLFLECFPDLLTSEEEGSAFLWNFAACLPHKAVSYATRKEQSIHIQIKMIRTPGYLLIIWPRNLWMITWLWFVWGSIYFSLNFFFFLGCQISFILWNHFPGFIIFACLRDWLINSKIYWGCNNDRTKDGGDQKDVCALLGNTYSVTLPWTAINRKSRGTGIRQAGKHVFLLKISWNNNTHIKLLRLSVFHVGSYLKLTVT